MSKALSTYNKLLKSVKDEIAVGRKAVEQATAAMYWKVGQHIARDLLQNKVRAGYGEAVVNRLSQDTQVDRATLFNALKFYRQYPKVGARRLFNWDHYRTLLRVEDLKMRRKLEERIVKENLNTRQLRQIVRAEKYASSRSFHSQINISSEPLKLVRGQLYHYFLKIVNGVLQVDCGFKFYAYKSLTGITQPKAKDILVCTKTGEDGYRFKRTTTAKNKTFTYKAFIDKITDGDTIRVNIDLGFHNMSTQRLRLRDVYAPELKTVEGQKAKKFVENQLKNVKFLVIKTYGYDKYDRPLADIFYLPGETDAHKVAAEGRFLNQELVDQGFKI